jgi:uncharacterized membrane protein YagU involved in acid resistance
MKAITMAPAQKITSDAVIDGLFGGLLAGGGMLVFLIAAGLWGGSPAMQTLSHFGIPGQSISPLASLLLHLGVSSVYGILFGLLINILPRKYRGALPGWLWGIFFGLLIWLLAELVLLPGSGSALLEIPRGLFAGSHVVYGLILGWFSAVTRHD